jgi:hypothetical protein
LTKARNLRVDAGDLRAGIVCGLAVLVFLGLGLLSNSTHNDDEVSRFLAVRTAWSSWDAVLSVWNRPAFVLAYLLPATLGYVGVKITTALLSALTCFLTYRCARARGWQPAWLAAVLVATQPLFLALSFSGLSEPLAACLLAASLLALYRKRWWASALLLAAAPLARPELAPLFLVWAVPLYRARAWKALASLPLGLAVWALAGFIHSGHPLWLWHQMFTGESRIYEAVGSAHYLAGYIFVVGPVVFVLSIPGIIDAVRRRGDQVLPAAVFLMLGVYTWLSIRSSAGQAAGFLRYLVTLSPFTALLAVSGFRLWAAPRVTLTTVSILVLAAAACGAFLSVDLVQGVWLGKNRDYVKLALVSVMAGIAIVRFARARFALRPAPGRTPGRTPEREQAHEERMAQPGRGPAGLAVTASVLAVGFALVHPPIARLSPEQSAIREAARWYEAAGLSSRVTMCNHPWFRFFLGASASGERVGLLTKAALTAAPDLSIAVWEGHYANRHGGDVTPEDVDQLGDWRILRRFLDAEARFAAVVLEKVPTAERAGRFASPGFVHPGFGVEWAGGGAADGWTWKDPRAGMALLTGSRGADRVYLNLIRFVGLGDPRLYYPRIESELRRNRALAVERVESLRGWSVIWGHDSRQKFFVASLVGDGRCEALQLSGTCAASEVTDMGGQLLRWLPSLRFVPGTASDVPL